MTNPQPFADKLLNFLADSEKDHSQEEIQRAVHWHSDAYLYGSNHILFSPNTPESEKKAQIKRLREDHMRLHPEEQHRAWMMDEAKS